MWKKRKSKSTHTDTHTVYIYKSWNLQHICLHGRWNLSLTNSSNFAIDQRDILFLLFVLNFLTCFIFKKISFRIKTRPIQSIHQIIKIQIKKQSKSYKPSWFFHFTNKTDCCDAYTTLTNCLYANKQIEKKGKKRESTTKATTEAWECVYWRFIWSLGHVYRIPMYRTRTMCMCMCDHAYLRICMRCL